jgi:hypothetical protein
VTESGQPDPDPQVSESVGHDGPAYSADLPPGAEVTSAASSSELPEDESLNWYEKLTLKTLRGLGADPAGASPRNEGRWPTTWQSFLWDLAPDKVAPPRDGVVLPRWEEPRWFQDVPHSQLGAAREAVRAELDRTLQSIAGLEQKAARLLTPFVALLTGAVALTVSQMVAIGGSPAGLFALAGAIFGGAGVGLLLVGMLRALDADTRLGTSLRATLDQELADNKRLALRSDCRGVDAAKFVLRKKGNRILFARAAISRGLVMLLMSAGAGAIGLAVTPDSNDARTPGCHHGPSPRTSLPATEPSPTPTLASPPSTTGPVAPAN